MTASEAQANPNTMISIMIVFGSSARVLFDSGSSRSFMSSSFALHADRELFPLKHKLVVTKPLGEQILCNTVFKRCEILIDGMVLKANLIPLKMYDFDVILGMHWLSIHRDSVDYFTKKVVFRKLGFPKLEFVGDCKILSTCVISTLKENKLLHKGFEAYLAHVGDKSTPEVTLDSVLVVRELQDMFFKDFPGLPPDQELKFRIELLPRSAPISIPPYRMVLVELKELKNQ